MCTVSMVGDHFQDQWKDWRDKLPPAGTSPLIPINTPAPMPFVTIGVSQQEFDDLKKEVEQMKKLLIKAKLYDEANNEPNCEMESKVAFLKQVAEYVGVNLDEIFGKFKSPDVPGVDMGGI